jgi:hypothetical protein
MNQHKKFYKNWIKMPYTFTKYYSKNRERKNRKKIYEGKKFQYGRKAVTVNTGSAI